MNETKLTRFVESYSFSNKIIKRVSGEELQESLRSCPSKLRESLSETPNEGFWLPISFYEKKNGNGRIYGKALWENVIHNQKGIWKGSPMLEDHPAGDSDGNPRDICGVWLDCKMDKPDKDGIGLVWGLLVPSGRLGEDLKDHLKKGLKIGTSSSGFGQLLYDGETVDPDTYQIERLADFVLNPSQNTWATWEEDTNSVVDRSIKESNEDTRNIMNENKIKENTMKDSKLAKLEEKKFRRDMESFLESADNIKDPQERLEEFKEIKSYLEDGACPDLREKIEKKIAEEEASIRGAIKDSVIFKEKFGIESADDLAEKLTHLSEDTKVIEEESQQWKSISEKLQEKYTEVKKELEKRPSETYVSALKDNNRKMAEQIISQNKKAYDVVKKLSEACADLQKSVEDFKKEVEDLEAEKADLNERITYLENTKALAEKADKMNMKSYMDLQEAYTESKKQREELIKVAEAQKEKISKYRERLSTYREKTKKANSINRELREDLEASEKSLLKVKKQKAIKENNARVENMSPVELYYEELYEEYGRDILPFKEKILSSPSLIDAKNTFYSKVLQNMRESKDIDTYRVPEALSITPKQRQRAMGFSNVDTSDSIDRLPEGWI